MFEEIEIAALNYPHAPFLIMDFPLQELKRTVYPTLLHPDVRLETAVLHAQGVDTHGTTTHINIKRVNASDRAKYIYQKAVDAYIAGTLQLKEPRAGVYYGQPATLENFLSECIASSSYASEEEVYAELLAMRAEYVYTRIIKRDDELPELEKRLGRKVLQKIHISARKRLGLKPGRPRKS